MSEGTGIRVYAFGTKAGLIKRIPYSKYDRAHREAGVFPEYAGKEIRFAMAIFGLRNREPVVLRRLDLFVLIFDSSGGVDKEHQFEVLRLAMGSMPPLGEKPLDILESLQPGLNKMRLKDKYKWEMNKVELSAFQAVLSKELGM